MPQFPHISPSQAHFQGRQPVYLPSPAAARGMHALQQQEISCWVRGLVPFRHSRIPLLRSQAGLQEGIALPSKIGLFSASPLRYLQVLRDCFSYSSLFLLFAIYVVFKWGMVQISTALFPCLCSFFPLLAFHSFLSLQFMLVNDSPWGEGDKLRHATENIAAISLKHYGYKKKIKICWRHDVISLKISKWVIRQRTEKAFLWDIWREDYEHNKVKATVIRQCYLPVSEPKIY